MDDILFRIRTAVSRFMSGRNGMDALNQALCWFYVILTLSGVLLMRPLKLYLLTRIIATSANLTVLAVIFRTFSRNLPRRQAENRRWISIWNLTRFHTRNLIQSGTGSISRIRDRKHKYFTCKHCGTVCRVPRGKGNIIITCPHCGEQIHAKS